MKKSITKKVKNVDMWKKTKDIINMVKYKQYQMSMPTTSSSQ